MHIRKPISRRACLERGALSAAADKEEFDVAFRAKRPGEFKHGFEIMHAAEISRVGDDKFALQVPRGAKRRSSLWLEVGEARWRPVRHDRDPLWADASVRQHRGHVGAKGNAAVCAAPR